MTLPANPDALACESCGVQNVPIDLNVKATPPEYLCRKCIKMCKCPRCGKRKNRLVSEPGGAICHACIRRRDKNAAAYWREFEAERAE